MPPSSDASAAGDPGSKPMSVVQFCTNFKKGGGIQTHVMGLSEYLRGQGHKVWFAGEAANSGLEQTETDFLPLNMHKISETTGKSGLFSRVMALLGESLALRRFIRKNRVQIIHAHETAPALVARLATLGTRVKTIMTFHGSDPSRLPSAAKTAERCADLVASPSRTCLNNLIQHGLDPRKARLFGLGIPPIEQADAAAVRAIRERYLSDPDGVMIFSPSRLAYQKGIDVMIDVAKQVSAEYPNAVFVVAGDGVLADQVPDWAEQAGVAEHVKFIGRIDDVPVHLQACDLFLLTSRWEAFPIAIVEAFRAGRPVVATRCGGVAELVDDTVGAICEVEDVDGIARAISDLMKSPARRDSCGLNAVQRSDNPRFDPLAVHSEIEREYLMLADPVEALKAYQIPSS